MSDERPADVLLAFGIGVIAGAVAALLLSPASGEENRRFLRERAASLKEKVRERSREAQGQLREQADHLVAGVKAQAGRVSHAIEEGKKAYAEGAPSSRG